MFPHTARTLCLPLLVAWISCAGWISNSSDSCSTRIKKKGRKSLRKLEANTSMKNTSLDLTALPAENNKSRYQLQSPSQGTAALVWLRRVHRNFGPAFPLALSSELAYISFCHQSGSVLAVWILSFLFRLFLPCPYRTSLLTLTWEHRQSVRTAAQQRCQKASGQCLAAGIYFSPSVNPQTASLSCAAQLCLDA